MARNSLPYKVECKSFYPFYELIAAFDCESAAVNYMADCKRANPGNAYRILKGKKVL